MLRGGGSGKFSQLMKQTSILKDIPVQVGRYLKGAPYLKTRLEYVKPTVRPESQIEI